MRAIIGLLPFIIVLIGFGGSGVDGGWFSFKSAVKEIGAQSVLQMPGVIPHQNESYLCTAFTLNTEETHFLVGFNPIAEMHQVHHLLLFGCEEPGSEEEVWDCGEMSTVKGQFQRSSTCTSQPDILYAWARNAPKLELPEGVGFRVGGGTRNRYLVLQVHYMHAMNKEDTSGVRVTWTTQEQPRTAATLLLATGGQIKPKSIEELEAACVVDESVEIHPFAYRVHTHRHGTNVQGWAINQEQWSLLGERDPQLPQLFEPVDNKSLVVREGDVIAARCTIKNGENRVIEVGPTGEDEMCNFYLMYWVDGDRVLGDNTCFSPGAPEYYWSRDVKSIAQKDNH